MKIPDLLSQPPKGGRSNPFGDLLGDGGTDSLGIEDFVGDWLGLGRSLAGIFSTRRLEIPSPESTSELESLEVLEIS